MIIIYVRIYLISSRIARAEALAKPSVEPTIIDQCTSLTHSTLISEQRRDSGICAAAPSNTTLEVPNGRAVGHGDGDGRSRSRAFSVVEFIPEVRRRSVMFFSKSRFAKISSSHERKATKTLGVIMGAFTACWLPFFILALIKPFCYDQESCIPQWLSSLFLWLGYANSLLNPIIYARFNRDFRTPFKHILQCHIRGINVRMRSDNYAEQFGSRPRPSIAGADLLQHPRDSMTSTADVSIRVQGPTNRTKRVTDAM